MNGEIAESERKVQRCVEAFKKGEPIMVVDSAFRERETDLLWPATAATPLVMRTLRKDCGGLLFLAIGNDVGELFDLPWLQDLHTTKEALTQFPVLDVLRTDDLQYDTRSAFTLSLNHRNTYTGITDKDRALTTRRFGELTHELMSKSTNSTDAIVALGKEFRTPGHIPLCREAPGGLATRQGHTELAVSIARLANVTPCTIGAEMLMPDGDGALPLEEAIKYSEKHNIPMITGADLMRAHGLKPVVKEHVSATGNSSPKRQKTE